MEFVFQIFVGRNRFTGRWVAFKCYEWDQNTFERILNRYLKYLKWIFYYFNIVIWTQK